MLEETILSIRDLNNSIEKGISDDKIKCIKGNIKKAKGALRGASLSKYLNTNLTNFEDTINQKFSNTLIEALKSIEDHLSCDRYDEAEISLKNINKAIDELNDIEISDELKSKKNTLEQKINEFPEDINRRDYSNIKKYSEDPPKEVLTILKRLSTKNKNFKNTYSRVQQSVENSVNLAITELKNKPFEEISEEIKEIRIALR